MGMIESLIDHKYDAIIAAMSITEEREKHVNFTDKYAQIPSKFVAKAGMIIDLDNTVKTRIGVQKYTTQANFLKDVYSSKVIVVEYLSFDDAFQDLLDGKLAAVF